MLRKLPKLTIQETLWQSHSQCQRLPVLGPPSQQPQWASRCLPWLPTHSTHMQPDQASLQFWPWFSYGRITDVSFHIHSWCSNTRKKLEMMPLRGTPWLLSPQSPSMSKSCSSSWVLHSCCMSTWLSPPVFVSLLTKGLAVLDPMSWATTHSSISISICSWQIEHQIFASA